MAPSPSSAAVEQAISRVFSRLSARPSGADLDVSPRALREAIEPGTDICAHAQSRLPFVGDAAMRRRDIRAWLRSALCAFGPTPACHVAVGPGDSAWMRLDTGGGVDWLADLALSRDDGAPGGHGASPIRSRQGDGLEDLIVVTEDRARALVLRTAEDELFSYLLPLREIVDRAESLARLRAAAAKVPGARARGRPSWNLRVPADAVREGSATVERLESRPGDRASAFVQALSALAEADARTWESKPEDARGPAPSQRACLVATGTLGTLAWLSVDTGGSASWAEALWDAGGLDRLFVTALRGDHALGLFSRGEALASVVNRLDEMRAA